MSRVLVLASGKGGVGKTTLAANLGVALAGSGKKTALVDLDFGLRNIDVALGMETEVFNHLGDYFAGELSWEETVTRDERFPNLGLFAAAQYYDPESVTQESFDRLIKELRAQFDLILIDSPAGVGPLFQLAISQADEGIAVTSPIVPAVRDADQVLHRMEEAGIPRRFILVNQLRFGLLRSEGMMAPEEIADVLGVSLVGVVPEDEGVIIACNRGETIIGSDTAAGHALERIASRMQGNAVPLPKLTKRRGGLFHK